MNAVYDKGGCHSAQETGVQALAASESKADCLAEMGEEMVEVDKPCDWLAILAYWDHNQASIVSGY